jgi:hypothetical protein
MESNRGTGAPRQRPARLWRTAVAVRLVRVRVRCTPMSQARAVLACTKVVVEASPSMVATATRLACSVLGVHRNPCP